MARIKIVLSVFFVVAVLGVTAVQACDHDYDDGETESQAPSQNAAD